MSASLVISPLYPQHLRPGCVLVVVRVNLVRPDGSVGALVPNPLFVDASGERVEREVRFLDRGTLYAIGAAHQIIPAIGATLRRAGYSDLRFLDDPSRKDYALVS